MTLGILTDSTCDLPEQQIANYGIEVVASVVVMDGRSYVDGRDLSREDFYTRLPALREPATTSMPAPVEFTSAMGRLFERGCSEVLAMHAPELLTGIVNGSRLAARDFDGRVTVYDSGSLTLGLGFQVLAAAEVARNGGSAQEALAAAQSVRKRVYIRAALESLEYVRRSGRVPGLIASLGGLLRIKPYIALEEGIVRAAGVVRTVSQANEKVFEGLRQLGELQHLAILHTNAEPRARELLQRVMQSARKALPRDILIVNVTTVIGTHVGPNGLGFCAVTK